MGKPVHRTPFGERIHGARKAAGLTQKQVEKELGLGQSTLSELETQSHRSSYTAELARLYGVDPYWLATGVGSPKPPKLSAEALEVAAEFERLQPHERRKWRALLLLAMDGVNPEHIKPPPGARTYPDSGPVPLDESATKRTNKGPKR